MKEAYKEVLANHFGHESYADDGNVVGVTTAVVYAGKLLSSVPHPHPYRVPTLSVLREGNTFHCVNSKRWNGSAESKNLSMRRNFNRENREIPEISARASNHAIVEWSENAFGGTADRYVSTDNPGGVPGSESRNSEAKRMRSDSGSDKADLSTSSRAIDIKTSGKIALQPTPIIPATANQSTAPLGEWLRDHLENPNAGNSWEVVRARLWTDK